MHWRWTHSDVGKVTNKWSDSEAGALLSWAMWAAEDVGYLDHLDHRAFGGRRRTLYGYHPDVVDLAHVRWAAGSAVTAIDLCAAVLGRNYCHVKGNHQLALAAFVDKTKGLGLLAQLPGDAQRWVKAVSRDPDFGTVKRARNPMTHSRLPRTIQGGNRKPGPHEQRTSLPVGPNGALVGARDIVLLAKAVAQKHVEYFLDGVMARKY
jgi:hypothetical protein